MFKILRPVSQRFVLHQLQTSRPLTKRLFGTDVLVHMLHPFNTTASTLAFVGLYPIIGIGSAIVTIGSATFPRQNNNNNNNNNTKVTKNIQLDKPVAAETSVSNTTSSSSTVTENTESITTTPSNFSETRPGDHTETSHHGLPVPSRPNSTSSALVVVAGRTEGNDTAHTDIDRDTLTLTRGWPLLLLSQVLAFGGAAITANTAAGFLHYFAEGRVVTLESLSGHIVPVFFESLLMTHLIIVPLTICVIEITGEVPAVLYKLIRGKLRINKESMTRGILGGLAFSIFAIPWSLFFLIVTAPLVFFASALTLNKQLPEEVQGDDEKKELVK